MQSDKLDPKTQSDPEPPTAYASPEAIAAIIAWSDYHGPRRAQVLGNDYHEADYIAGVMTALFALDGAKTIPPIWYIDVMSGRAIYRAEKRAQEKERSNPDAT